MFAFGGGGWMKTTGGSGAGCGLMAAAATTFGPTVGSGFVARVLEAFVVMTVFSLLSVLGLGLDCETVVLLVFLGMADLSCEVGLGLTVLRG
jgi:hypothetical protein